MRERNLNRPKSIYVENICCLRILFLAYFVYEKSSHHIKWQQINNKFILIKNIPYNKLMCKVHLKMDRVFQSYCM